MNPKKINIKFGRKNGIGNFTFGNDTIKFLMKNLKTFEPIEAKKEI